METSQQQRQYICLYIDELTFDDTEEIYIFLSSKVDKSLFSVHGTGCSINLDRVPDEIILDLYKLLKQKI